METYRIFYIYVNQRLLVFLFYFDCITADLFLVDIYFLVLFLMCTMKIYSASGNFLGVINCICKFVRVFVRGSCILLPVENYLYGFLILIQTKYFS